ncbi:MAG: GAF domain-containing sensor histidine kinase [Chloroflexota bacterium]
MTNISSASDRSEAKLSALSEALGALTAELSLDRVLLRLAEITAHLVNARYAALGIPDDKGGMAQFFTYGMTDEHIAQMDHYPRGLGLLGLLIMRPEPIRLARMQDDERSVGFPESHPPMTSFLGVPIISKGKHLGSLYLCDRLDGKPFSKDDEHVVVMLASHAAIAIEKADLADQLQKLAVIEERDRISMELHDGIIQSIYAIGIKLDLTRLTLKDKPEAQEQIASANQDLNRVIEDLRKYIQDLRVGVNLSVALHEHLDEISKGFRQVSSARLVIEVARGFLHLTDERLHALVQIIRETLSNIVRHANATEVYLDLNETGRQLTLVISDNGQGFEPESVSRGSGLQNMRRRVQQLGGSVEIISQPARGTTLTVTLPY